MALDGVADLFWNVGRLGELNGKALGLSISHDLNEARMYAYFLTIDFQKLSTQQPMRDCAQKHRAMIASVSINNRESRDVMKPHDFIYNACIYFSQRHLARIKTAIALLPRHSAATPAAGVNGPQKSSQAARGDIKNPKAGTKRKLAEGREPQHEYMKVSQDLVSSLREGLAHQREHLARCREYCQNIESSLIKQLYDQQQHTHKCTVIHREIEGVLQERLAHEQEELRKQKENTNGSLKQT